MGMLALNRLMSLQRDRQRRRQIRARCGFTATTGKRKGSPCRQDHSDSKPLKITKSSIEDLSEDILCRIHSLLPMREAASAACVARAFLRSWRCHPNLIFNKDTIGVKKNGRGENFHHKIDRILRNHSGISLKTFSIDYAGMIGYNGSSYFDSWLQIALKPGIEEVALLLSETEKQYNFPCSLLSDGVRNSLQCLKLYFVAFHPTVELGPLGSLKRLHLFRVNITWDELKCLLCNSLALEQLELESCPKIICLKIPCALQRLSCLSVVECKRLEVIESKAPNLSSISLRGHRLNFSLVKTLQVKKLVYFRSNFIYVARAELPAIMPNLETLEISSQVEAVVAPMLPTKFLNLKHLNILLSYADDNSRLYDYLSLVSFLDASPSLETLVLTVPQRNMTHESVFADSQLRDMPDLRHGYLKSVKIFGFSSAKCLVELACYILKSAVSLECLTLDTIYLPRCGGEYKYCFPMPNGVLKEAPRALSAIRTYIENKVPSTVKLTVLEPCSRCHVRGI